MPFGFVKVGLSNGKKYKISCTNVIRFGNYVFCELVDNKELDFGIMFHNGKMYLYSHSENTPIKCPENYKLTNLLFLGSFCVKEINDIKGTISAHLYEEIDNV